MKKYLKRLRILGILLTFFISFNTFSAVVSDNDGRAFISKAEFDSLKNSFQSQLNEYNVYIDSKIDDAIASYLAGVKVTVSGEVDVLNPGVQWSIGYFDRPRFKLGFPLINMRVTRDYYTNRSYTVSTLDMLVNWGVNFDKKVEFDPEKNASQSLASNWIYRDLIVENVKDNSGASFVGVYNNSGHYIAYNDVPPAGGDGDWLIRGDRLQNNTWANNSQLYAGFAQTATGGSETQPVSFLIGISASNSSDIRYRKILTNSALTLNKSTNFSQGIYNAYSIVKGSRITWDDKISVFAPIDYKCFNKEQNDVDYGPFYRNTGIRDEILYSTINLDTAGQMGHNDGSWNPLYYCFPDLFNFPMRNPWGLSNLNDTNLQCRSSVNAYYLKASGTRTPNNAKPIIYSFKFNPGRGWNDYSTSYRWTHKYYYVPDVKFAAITNWNQLGKSMDMATKNFVERSNVNATITDSEDNELLSLASGVPVCTLKGRTVTIASASFLKNPQWSWDTTKKQNVFSGDDEKVATNLEKDKYYVIWAKDTPFDKTKFPENETGLLDISEGSSATHRVGKIAKCLVVKGGNFTFKVENKDKADKILFLKWEELDNWNAARTARNTADATNYDVHVVGSNTETISLPKWTKFGGGYLKFPKKYQYKSIEM